MLWRDKIGKENIKLRRTNRYHTIRCELVNDTTKDNEMSNNFATTMLHS